MLRPIALAMLIAASMPVGAANIVSGGNLTAISSAPATKVASLPQKTHLARPAPRATAPRPKAVNANAFYSDITTFLGQAYANAGSATVGSTLTTNLVCDDVTYAAIETARTIAAVRFSVGNLNGDAVSARPFLRFFDSDGTDGAPGTLLGGVTFNPVSVNAMSISTVTGTLSTPIALPGRGAAVTIWACQGYDAGGTSTANTSALLDNMAIGLFDPPDVGSSQDGFWGSDAPDTFSSNNPAGGLFDFGGDPVANFGWELRQATPYPVELQKFSVE